MHQPLRNPNRLRIVATLALLITQASPALASSTATATLGPLTITLYDLNPTDAIAPAILFSAADNSNTLAQSNTGSTANSDLDTGVGPWSPISSGAATSGAWANASIGGSGAPNGTTQSASGTALGVPGSGSATFLAMTYGSGLAYKGSIRAK
jgi:hypothetical protein